MLDDFEHKNEIVSTIITILIFIALNFIITKLTKRYAKASHLSEHRTNLIGKYIDYAMFLLFVVALVGVWGIKEDGLFGFIGGTLAVIGVAFFAQWSILSNITSGVIMFFTFPFRIGDVIRVHDKDFPIEAQIEDIKSFHTILRTREGEIITYPNSLLLQKGVSIVPIKQEDKEFYD
ncbi:mechanosensitive ion channel protein MscS [Flavobacterium akiainvivens]|uniref:Mechanosensitive ion channel protein MscS n=1 Tax=Flavobacterium akiainvivens TaxID=1202724 RepID=A0A0M9VGZ6_9FLAO|nr:mechanosensitive ion channel domain-containing protein [Flavobacterium akiainvivens]KOS05012.1 mechanosensitive ion channel protein MscS [Flavobacterium akiainvivens]SFQ40379.1 Mechanosensitive ion channel [Flavobacterium akiainvivens]